MGEFDTDNDMMAEQQARDTDGHSRQPGDAARDIDARSEQDRRAAHTAAMRAVSYTHLTLPTILLV